MNDEEEISRMLASLKTVAAPDDFEGGVRSRIVEHRDNNSYSGPTLLLVAKFAFPVLLLLAIGALFVLTDQKETSVDLVPPVEVRSLDAAVIHDSETGTSHIASTNNENRAGGQASVNRSTVNPKSVSRGGSEDVALSPDDSTVFPDGVDPRRATTSNAHPPTGGTISPEDVLLMIGISSNCSPAGCAATTVRERSIAAVAGIQSGDLISEIDGRSISSSTGVTGSFSVSELTLVRAGRRMTVSIARR